MPIGGTKCGRRTSLAFALFGQDPNIVATFLPDDPPEANAWRSKVTVSWISVPNQGRLFQRMAFSVNLGRILAQACESFCSRAVRIVHVSCHFGAWKGKTMRTAARLTFLLGALIAGSAVAAAQSAQPCTPDQFRRVVDEAGAALRRLHAENQPAIAAGLRRLKAKHGWTDDNATDKANALLSDAKTEGYDAKASELLIKLDQLAEGAPGTTPNCSRLGELEATALELQATVRVKTRYMLARIEGQLGPAPKVAAAEPAQAPPAPPATKVPPPAAKAPSAPPAKTAMPAPVAGWNANTVEDQASFRPEPVIAAPANTPRPAHAMPNLPLTADGFSADEIREASRGFFGTISAGLGNVIEHAFGKLGLPSAYVLGNEGGGAFIAGVRYGKGTLFTRGGRSREVYWHGPSIGYDFGAAGSKTMFLVYGLQDDLDVFSGFSGVDGAAYLVGGVGMTLLSDGKIVMAPIRSGVGLRLGASIGYVRFTASPTWNPF